MYTFKVFDKSLGQYVKIRIISDDKGGLDVMKCEKVQGMQEISQSDSIRIKEEKLKLQAVVADLSQVNKRWQRYNSDMQIYIKRLQATIEDQQEQLNNMADKSAEKLFSQTSQERETGDSGCWKCRPVIEFLRGRITSLEEEVSSLNPEGKLTCPFCFRQNQDSTAEKLSLQFRLEQACKHIDYLNRLMVNKGVLKTGYNFLPETQSCHMDEKLKSMDGLNFYECDGGSDSSATTSGEIDCKGVGKPTSRPLSPLHTRKDQFKSELFLPKGDCKDFDTASPTISSIYPNRSSKPHVDFFYSLEESDLEPKNPASTSRSVELDGSENFPNKLPPDRNIDGVTSTSSKNKIEPSTKDTHSSFDQSINNSLFKSNFSESSSNIFNSPLGADSLEESQVCKGSHFHQDNLSIGLLNPPLFCPHCHTVFPPDSNVSYNKHILSCQLL